MLKNFVDSSQIEMWGPLNCKYRNVNIIFWFQSSTNYRKVRATITAVYQNIESLISSKSQLSQNFLGGLVYRQTYTNIGFRCSGASLVRFHGLK